MLEERKDNLTDAPGTEPEEIVSWYTPKEKEPEVVCTYEQPGPLPLRACRFDYTDEAEAQPRRKRPKGLWLFIACRAVLIAVVVAASLWPSDEKKTRPGKGDNPSSIVDTSEVETSIHRVKGDDSVRLPISEASLEILSPQEIYEKVNPSTVTVVAEGEEGASVGTGVIMTSDGYIITNAHVISGGKTCWIALPTGVTYDAKLVGFDEPQDLAVLKVEPKEDLPAAEFGDSLTARVGDTVYAIGNPLGLELRGTMTDGMLSAVGRAMTMNGGTSPMLQTTAALNSGNSGGPLINAAGQVIGINTLKMSNTDLEHEATVEGLGFALPISDMKPVVDDLIAHGKFRGMPMLGVTVLTVTIEDVGNRVMVQTVAPGGGAEEAGVQANDFILSCDGAAVDHIDDLLTIRRDHRVGDTITLTIQRGSETFDVEVELRSDKDMQMP